MKRKIEDIERFYDNFGNWVKGEGKIMGKGKNLLISVLFSLTIMGMLTSQDVKAATYESENNNNFSAANHIELNDVVYGTNANSNDYDYYRFNAPANGCIYLSMTQKRDIGSHYFYLYDGNQDQYFESSIPYSNANMTTQKVSVKKGTNYIRVDSYNSYPYSFAVNYKSSLYWETEFNNHIDSANYIDLNTKYYGTNVNSNDNDYYYFNAPSNGYIYLTITHTKDVGSHYYYLYDGNQDQFFETSIPYSSANMTTQKVSVKKGMNYIRIHSYNANPYSFVVNYKASSYWESEFNNHIDSANYIDLNTKYYGTNVDSNDNDYYRFIAPSNGYIYLTMTQTKDIGSHYLYLYDGNQDQYFETSIPYSSANITTQKVSVKKGTNYVKIHSYNANPYSFVVHMDSPKPNSSKLTQPMTVKAKTITIKYAKVKKAQQVIQKAKLFTIKNAKGMVTFKKVSGSKYFEIRNNGSLVIKKGTKKGKYGIKVKVYAKGNGIYKAGYKPVKLIIKVA